MLFAANHCSGISEDKVASILDDFISTIKRDQLYSVPTKLDDYMVSYKTDKITIDHFYISA